MKKPNSEKSLWPKLEVSRHIIYVCLGVAILTPSLAAIMGIAFLVYWMMEEHWKAMEWIAFGLAIALSCWGIGFATMRSWKDDS